MAKTILIVEDEAPVVKALYDKLTQEGYIVHNAENGVEGLKFALSNHPDLILLDVLLPKMDGMEMLKRLRKDQWGEHVPVIVLTNLSEPENVIEGLDQYVYDYLVKADWKLEDVIKKIKERLT